MTDQVIDLYESELGIEFTDAHVGWQPLFNNARSNSPGIPSTRSEHLFGIIGGASTVEYDVIAHELGHTILREFISSAQIQGGSLHEAISDMFGTYIESKLTGLDWVMGDDMPLVIRDLENTSLNCFTNISGLTSVHSRGEALGHWFFLCVNGDANTNIPPMDIDEVMALVVEALPNLGNNPDYPDLMEVIMDLAESLYGTCSGQFVTILRAWEQICVPTNHRMADPNEPCIVLTGSYSVCEEYNYLNVCISSNFGISTAAGRWTIIGKNSVYFKSVHGMQGNSQQGGSCIQIYEIPDMPYYPQTITIQYYNSDIGETITRRVIIMDCDGDDPTCEEYYGIQGRVLNDGLVNNFIQDRVAESLPEKLADNNQPLKIIVFDLMGNRLNISKEQLRIPQGYRPRIVLLTYWDINGVLIKSEKMLIH